MLLFIGFILNYVKQLRYLQLLEWVLQKIEVKRRLWDVKFYKLTLKIEPQILTNKDGHFVVFVLLCYQAVFCNCSIR